MEVEKRKIKESEDTERLRRDGISVIRGDKGKEGE
jgi:hypothetical protein